MKSNHIILIYATSFLIISSCAGHSKECLSFNEGMVITVVGKVSKQPIMVVGEGEPKHQEIELTLKRPICFNKTNFAEGTIVIFPNEIAEKYLGENVTITGKTVAGDAWALEIDKIVKAKSDR